jgi:flavin-dependent dehydrogenase
VIDVLIAGGGPVGLATALYAHEQGLEVVLCEPRSAPVEKACGEGLMPSAVAALAELGISLSGRDFRGIRYTDGSRTADALFRAGPGRGVARGELHEALWQRVVTADIPIIARPVTEFSQDEGSVLAAGLRSRYLVAADGLHSTVRRRCGLQAPSRPAALPRWGLRQHYRLAPWSDLVEVHWSACSEAYVTPLADDLVNVAVLTRTRAPFADQLRAFPELADRLRGAEVGGVRGAGPLRQRTSGRVAGRVLLVGDAAGYVDALTGEGIAVGLACAHELAHCLHADNPGAYEARWRRASRRYRYTSGLLLWLSAKPLLRRTIVPLSASAPPLFGSVVRQIGH